MNKKECILEVLAKVKGDDLPSSVYVSLDLHPELQELAKIHGSETFKIGNAHGVPFFADPKLAEGEVRVISGARADKIFNLKK